MQSSIAAATDCTEASEWTRAMAEYRSSREEYDRFHTNVWQPLAEELDRVSPRPDLTFEVVAQSGQRARYLVPANDLHAWDDHISPTFRAKAAAVRTAWLDHKAASERLGCDAAAREADRLCDQMCDRESDLLVKPAPDLDALLWKLERLFGPDVRSNDDYCDSWCAERINAVMDDARRLLSDPDRRRLVQAMKLAA